MYEQGMLTKNNRKKFYINIVGDFEGGEDSRG